MGIGKEHRWRIRKDFEKIEPVGPVGEVGVTPDRRGDKTAANCTPTARRNMRIVNVEADSLLTKLKRIARGWAMMERMLR